MTGLELPLLTLALLVAASFVAGWVDSVVGGGGGMNDAMSRGSI